MLNWRQPKMPFYSVLNLIYYIKSTETTKSRINILRFCSQLWLYFSRRIHNCFASAAFIFRNYGLIRDCEQSLRTFYFHVTCNVRFNFANFHKWLRLLSSAAQSQRRAYGFMPCKSVDWIAWSACPRLSSPSFFGALILFTRTHAHTRAHTIGYMHGMDNNDIFGTKTAKYSKLFKVINILNMFFV